MKNVLSDDNGPILITCMSISSLISRLAFGPISDLKCINIIRLEQFWLFVGSVLVTSIPWSATFGGLVVISVILGVYDGILWLLFGPITLYLVGPRDAGQAIGFAFIFVSLGFLSVSPVGGV